MSTATATIIRGEREGQPANLASSHKLTYRTGAAGEPHWRTIRTYHVGSADRPAYQSVVHQWDNGHLTPVYWGPVVDETVERECIAEAARRFLMLTPGADPDAFSTVWI